MEELTAELPAGAAIALLAYGLGVAVLTLAEMTGRHAICVLVKPALAAGFVALALWMGALSSGYGQLMLAGLAFCAVGDVLLLGRAEKIFMAGIGAFLTGHLFYAAAFAGLSPVWSSALLRLAFMVVIGFGVWRWLQRFVPKGLQIAVILYVIVILAMVFLAIGASLSGASALIAVAAVAFAISDLGVARDRFIGEAAMNKIVITPLYFGAQAVFALSVAIV